MLNKLPNITKKALRHLSHAARQHGSPAASPSGMLRESDASCSHGHRTIHFKLEATLTAHCRPTLNTFISLVQAIALNRPIEKPGG